jgi:hypothetical protein
MYSGFVPEPECGQGLAAANPTLTLTTAPLQMICSFLRAELSVGSAFFLFNVLLIPSSISGLKRVLELWPYVFVAISVTGLAYIALNAAR